MRTLLVSDIHGQFDAFMELLILSKYRPGHDRLIILGDLIDRGPKSDQVLDWVINNNIEVIMGNHEHAFLGYMAGRCPISNYLDTFVGGQVTLDNYSRRSESDLIRHLKFIGNLPKYIELKDHILVHGGLDITVPIHLQTIGAIAWDDTTFYSTKGIPGKTVVFGHIPTDYLHGPGYRQSKIWRDPVYKNKIGIDCNNKDFKRLACLDLYNDIEYYYSVYTKKGEMIKIA